MYVAYYLPGHATGSDKTRASLVCSYRLKPMDNVKKNGKGHQVHSSEHMQSW